LVLYLHATTVLTLCLLDYSRVFQAVTATPSRFLLEMKLGKNYFCSVEKSSTSRSATNIFAVGLLGAEGIIFQH